MKLATARWQPHAYVTAALLCTSPLHGCSGADETGTVVVQLQTDLVAGEEFDTADLTLWPLDEKGQFQHIGVPIDDGTFYPAAPLTELQAVPPGDYRLELLLRDQARGRTVIEQPALLSVQHNLSVTVPVTRSCLGIFCPEGQSCLGGQCVDQGCTLAPSERCDSLRQCTTAADCQPAASCAVGDCQMGVCWAVSRGSSDAEGCDASTEWCHPESQCQPRSKQGLDDPESPVLHVNCSDGSQNGDETDTDCGGSCAPCADDRACLAPSDCSSLVCTGQVCQAPTCSDSVQNGSETGVDCGGSCSACSTTILQLSSFEQHTCVYDNHGDVFCWGRNLSAQIKGDGSTATKEQTAVQASPGFAGAASAVSVTATRSCALDTTGQAYCWGKGAAAAAISGAVNLSTLAGGKDFTCGITSAGGVLCWGTGNPTGATSFAVAVAGLSNVTALGLGDDHACALISDGTIRCWGDNTSGQLGDGSNTQSSTPVTVSGISDASAIAAGSRFNCAVRTGGSVNCWGDNTSGQLGDGSQTASNLPVTTTGLSDATQLDAGWEHVCARTRSGHMYCWGSNSGYQLGVVNPRPTATTPQQVRHNLDGAVLAGVAQVSLGGGTTCFLRNDGVTLTCWSANRFGSCGTGASGNNVSTFNNFTLP